MRPREWKKAKEIKDELFGGSERKRRSRDAWLGEKKKKRGMSWYVERTGRNTLDADRFLFNAVAACLKSNLEPRARFRLSPPAMQIHANKLARLAWRERARVRATLSVRADRSNPKWIREFSRGWMVSGLAFGLWVVDDLLGWVGKAIVTANSCYDEMSFRWLRRNNQIWKLQRRNMIKW